MLRCDIANFYTPSSLNKFRHEMSYEGSGSTWGQGCQIVAKFAFLSKLKTPILLKFCQYLPKSLNILQIIYGI